MNPQTMTCDQCRDELARMDGWQYETGPVWQWRRFVDGKQVDHLDSVSDDHPHPPTLDGAAGALPEGWKLVALEDVGVYSGWSSAARAYWPLPPNMCFGHGPDELTARYRLAVACRLAMEKTT